MTDEAIYEERARNKSVRAMVQEMRQLERERDAIAEIVAGAGLDGGLLQWRVESIVKQRDEARAVARRMKRQRDLAMKEARLIFEQRDAYQNRTLDFEDAIHEAYYEMVPLEWAYVDPFTALEAMLRHHQDCAAKWADALTEIVKLKEERDLWKSRAEEAMAERDAARRWARAFKMLAKENADLAAKLVIKLYGPRAGRDKPAEGE